MRGRVDVARDRSALVAVCVDVQIEPAPLAARVGDLVVRVADQREREPPALGRLAGQRLRLARDAEDLAARGADRLDDTLLLVAA